MNFVLLSSLFLFSLLLVSTNAITIFLSNGNNLSLPSHYSTLGIHPSSNQQFNFTIISSKSFTGCELTSPNNIIQNKIILFHDSIPMFSSCNKSPHATRVILSKILQNNGALGLIIQQPDEV